MNWGQERKSLSGFVVVGCVGFLVDAGVLTWLVSEGAGPYVGRVVSFAVAVAITFVLNRNFTFNAAGASQPVTQFANYVGAQLGGAALNLGLYVCLLSQVPSWASQPWIPLAFGSVAAMLLTYTLSRLIFRR